MNITEAITEARENVVANFSTEPCVIRALLSEIDRLSASECNLLGALKELTDAEDASCDQFTAKEIDGIEKAMERARELLSPNKVDMPSGRT